LGSFSEAKAGHHKPQRSVLDDANCPPTVYGFRGNTYRWGYFGVNYWPYVVHHRGYYGGYYEWGTRRGY
jgi:hypothetical protein